MKLFEQVNNELFLEITKKSQVFGSKTSAYRTLGDMEKGRRNTGNIKGHKIISEEELDRIVKEYEETDFLYLILPFEDYVSEPYIKNPTTEKQKELKAEREAKRKQQEKLKAEREAKRKEQERKKAEKAEQARIKELQKKSNITERIIEWDNEILEATPYYLMMNNYTFVSSVGLHRFYAGPRHEYPRKLIDNILKKPYTFYMNSSKGLEIWLSQDALNCLLESKNFDEEKLRIFPFSKYQQAYYYTTTGKDWEEVLRKEREEYEETKQTWRYQEINRTPKQRKSWRKGAGKKKKRRK